MHRLFSDLPNVECFIDDIGIFTLGSFDDHLHQLHQVLLRLERDGFTVNPSKYDWATKSTEYFGFLLTPNGIKPLPNKVQAITQIARPTSTKHVCSFVGLVNYCKDMWLMHAHFFALLTDVCSTRKKFVWTDRQEHAFQNIKRLVSEDVMLRSPNHKEPFQIFTDARTYQIGATIKQNKLPIAYFSRKLTPTQRRYSTIGQELLAIVEALWKYMNFLLGARIIIFADYKNLVSNNSANDCVFQWKQKIKEFAPTIHYVQGQTNVEADALSRLPVVDNQRGLEVMLNYPQLDPSNPILNNYHLYLTVVNKYQQLDQALTKTVKEDRNFKFIQLYDNQLVVYQLQRSKNQCIVISQ